MAVDCPVDLADYRKPLANHMPAQRACHRMQVAPAYRRRRLSWLARVPHLVYRDGRMGLQGKGKEVMAGRARLRSGPGFSRGNSSRMDHDTVKRVLASLSRIYISRAMHRVTPA